MLTGRTLRRLPVPAIVSCLLVLAGALMTAPAASSAPAPTAPAVTAGAIHSVVLRSDGSLWSCGYHTLGQLGRTPTALSPVTTFAPVTAAGPWSQVAGGFWHTLAIAADGTLWSWGDNLFGEIGRTLSGGATSTVTPSKVGNDTSWALVASGPTAWHSVAIKQDGTLWSWGRNSSGQLGLGAIDGVPHPVPAQVGAGSDWAAVAGGSEHTVAVKQDGTIWSWGDNSLGQLGRLIDAANPQAVPCRVGSTADWTRVWCGDAFTLALKRDGTLWAWGANTKGQLGQSGQDGVPHSAPLAIGTAADWVAASCGDTFAVALKADGTLWSWGDNGNGQLGRTLGGPTWAGTPGRVGLTSDWASIATGANHVMALKRGGTAWTWGLNNSGQIGNGTLADALQPLEIMSLDATPPSTTAQGVPTEWSKLPVAATLLGTDNLSGVWAVHYSLDGGAAWTTTYGGSPVGVTVSANGISTIQFYAIDNAGNVEAQGAATVRIDGQGPQTVALTRVGVRQGQKATFRFRVNDVTPQVKVTIRIFKGARLMKSVAVGSKNTNSAQSYRWKCALAKGRYVWKVYATDQAGNRQRTIGSKALTVR